jgi:hypothetical protein
LALSQIAVMRSDGIDSLGLGSDDPDYLEKRLNSFSDQDHEALIKLIFSTGRATLDRLLANTGEQEPPTALWAEGADPRSIAGQTLLWADHYLADDAVAGQLLHHPEKDALRHLARPLAREMSLRPLLETGVVALVPLEVASLLVADDAYSATEHDLAVAPLVDWILSELVVEGPTAREVIFVRARDHDDEAMYIYGRIQGMDDAGVVTSTSLTHSYDPDHNYGPWIDQSKRQVAARLLQGINMSVAVAHALGGHALATTPFVGRVLARKEHPSNPAQSLVWADVPTLPQASATALAKLAHEDETVEALRRTVRRSFAEAPGVDAAAARELAEQLHEDARVLNRTMRREQRWKLVAPASLSLAGIGIGGLTGGPLGVVAGALGGLAGLVGTRAERAAHRENPAYALLFAQRERRREERAA